jgi:hypothetical protein
MGAMGGERRSKKGAKAPAAHAVIEECSTGVRKVYNLREDLLWRESSAVLRIPRQQANFRTLTRRRLWPLKSNSNRAKLAHFCESGINPVTGPAVGGVSGLRQANKARVGVRLHEANDLACGRFFV